MPRSPKKPPPPKPPTNAQRNRELLRAMRDAAIEMSNVLYNLAHGWDFNDATRHRACEASRKFDRALSQVRGAKAL